MRVLQLLLATAFTLLLAGPAASQDEIAPSDALPGAAEPAVDSGEVGTPLTPTSASEAPRACTIHTPLPPALTIRLPTSDLPPGLAAFSGVWEGKWDSGLPARIAVTQIYSSSAVVYYSFAATERSSAGVTRYDADVLPGNQLDMQGGQFHFTFTMGDDLSIVTGTIPQGTTTVQMARCTAPRVSIAQPSPSTPTSGGLGFALPTTAMASDVGVTDKVGVVEDRNAVQVQAVTSSVVGTLFRPTQRTQPLPGVLMLQGSEGYDAESTAGGMDGQAKHLAAQGFITFRLCYFGCSGRPPVLQRIALEYVLSAIRYLKSLPEVDADNVSVFGWSRGGELALLIGSMSPDLRGVIAQSGSPRVYGSPTAHDCAWTSAGDCIVSGTPIPVEQIRGPVLVLVGQVDEVWPASLSQQIADELEHIQHPHQLTIFPNTGHLFGGLSCITGTFCPGGPAYVNAARVTFAQTVAFLKALAAQPA